MPRDAGRAYYFRVGFTAAYCGHEATENPYVGYSSRFDAWAEGWAEAGDRDMVGVCWSPSSRPDDPPCAEATRV